MNVNENISSDVIVLLFDDHVEEILFHALMEDSGNDCLTLYDLQENENLQTYNIPDEDCFFNSVYPASPTQFPQNRGDNLQVRADESSELQNRCQLFMKIFDGSNKKRATSQKRKQHEAVQQDYKRIMNSFVRILPKPQVENGIIQFRTHLNGWWCIMCGRRFTDFNLFKLHHDSNKHPHCSSLNAR